MYRVKDDIKGLVLKASVRPSPSIKGVLPSTVSLIKLTTAVAIWLFGLLPVVLVVIWSFCNPSAA